MKSVPNCQTIQEETLQEDIKKALQKEDITGIYPYRKMTSKKDNHTRREPYKKTGIMPYRKKTSQEFNLTER